MNDYSGNIKAIADFIDRLSVRKVLLAFFFVILGLLLYSLYENRVAAFVYVIGSPYLLLAIGGSMVLLLVIWVVAVSITRVEEFLNRKIDDQSKIIDTLHADLEHCKTDCRDLSQGFLKQILEKLDERK